MNNLRSKLRAFTAVISRAGGMLNHGRKRQKQFGGQTKFARTFFHLTEYFFACPNMTDLVGKFHVIN